MTPMSPVDVESSSADRTPSDLVAAAEEISRSNPGVPMLLLTVHDLTRQLIEEAQKAGFRGAVAKSNGTEVIEGVKTLLRNETFFRTNGEISAA